MTDVKQIKVTLVRSLIKKLKTHKDSVHGLGLTEHTDDRCSVDQGDAEQSDPYAERQRAHAAV